MNDYELNEVAINWNAPLTYALASFLDANTGPDAASGGAGGSAGSGGNAGGGAGGNGSGGTGVIVIDGSGGSAVAGGTRTEVRAVPAAAVPAAAVLAAATRAAVLGQALVVRVATRAGAPAEPRTAAARARVVRIQVARPAARQRRAASRARAARLAARRPGRGCIQSSSSCSLQRYCYVLAGKRARQVRWRKQVQEIALHQTTESAMSPRCRRLLRSANRHRAGAKNDAAIGREPQGLLDATPTAGGRPSAVIVLECDG